uniref:Uncharacterized protein n=1 Tax=Mycena chlorophos TaxID=658473 RepID=A0ABQ0LHV5_MYCCL|nr:predicted protein [Mycena chlorophos]
MVTRPEVPPTAQCDAKRGRTRDTDTFEFMPAKARIRISLDSEPRTPAARETRSATLLRRRRSRGHMAELEAADVVQRSAARRSGFVHATALSTGRRGNGTSLRCSGWNSTRGSAARPNRAPNSLASSEVR